MPKPSVSADQYYIEGNFDLLVATLAASSSSPTTVTVTVTEPAEEGDATLTISALSTKLYEGTRIRFGASNQNVFLMTDAASNATSLSIRPLTADIADNATGTTYALKPVSAIEEIGSNKQDRTIEINTSDSPTGSTEELKLGQTKTRTCKCYDIQNNSNPGLEVLKVAGEAEGQHAYVYYEIVRSNYSGEYGNALIKNFNEAAIKKDEPSTFTWEMRIQGNPTKFAAA